jgi:acetyltransferase-like isoleucine patch superfamily enzyme
MTASGASTAAPAARFQGRAQGRAPSPAALGPALKRAIKAGLLAFGCVAVCPLAAACALHRRLGLGFYYADYTTLVALIPTGIGRLVRAAFYRLTLKRCGHDLVVGFGSYFVYQDSEVGDCFGCGSYCVLGKCRMGDHVAVASRVSVISGLHQHGTDSTGRAMLDQLGERRQITLGSDVWIGEGAVVGADVGDGAVIGVGSVVTAPVAANAVVLGNPARMVRRRDAEGAAEPAAAGAGNSVARP